VVTIQFDCEAVRVQHIGTSFLPCCCMVRCSACSFDVPVTDFN